MGGTIKITCECNQRYKIIHFLLNTIENDNFVYQKSEIYLQNKKFIERKGCIIVNLNDYRLINIIDCKCKSIIKKFDFYISEKNCDFIIKNIDLLWQRSSLLVKPASSMSVGRWRYH